MGQYQGIKTKISHLVLELAFFYSLHRSKTCSKTWAAACVSFFIGPNSISSALTAYWYMAQLILARNSNRKLILCPFVMRILVHLHGLHLDPDPWLSIWLNFTSHRALQICSVTSHIQRNPPKQCSVEDHPYAVSDTLLAYTVVTGLVLYHTDTLSVYSTNWYTT